MKRLLIVFGLVLIVPMLVVVADLREKRPVRHGLEAAGCRSVSARREDHGPRSVLVVGVYDCLDGTGRAVSAGEAVDRIMRVVWSTPASWFDAVAVSVSRTAERPDSGRATILELSRGEVAARWGPRAVTLDWVLPDPSRGKWLWTLVLDALVVAIGVPVVLGVHLARRGVVLVVWRR
jgi:hypothetical protein